MIFFQRQLKSFWLKTTNKEYLLTWFRRINMLWVKTFFGILFQTTLLGIFLFLPSTLNFFLNWGVKPICPITGIFALIISLIILKFLLLLTKWHPRLGDKGTGHGNASEWNRSFNKGSITRCFRWNYWLSWWRQSLRCRGHWWKFSWQK